MAAATFDLGGQDDVVGPKRAKRSLKLGSSLWRFFSPQISQI